MVLVASEVDLSGKGKIEEVREGAALQEVRTVLIATDNTASIPLQLSHCYCLGLSLFVFICRDYDNGVGGRTPMEAQKTAVEQGRKRKRTMV